MTATQRETVQLLCKSVITRLENKKAISFPPRLRQVVQDEVFDLVGPYILTDQDVRDRAIRSLGEAGESLQESSATETEQFRTAKSVVRSQLGDHVLNGFYFQRPIKAIAEMISAYLMRSSNIEEVFDSDDEIEKFVVQTIQSFNPANAH